MQVSSGSSLYPNIKTGRLPSIVNGNAMTPFRTDFAVLGQMTYLHKFTLEIFQLSSLIKYTH